MRTSKANESPSDVLARAAVAAASAAEAAVKAATIARAAETAAKPTHMRIKQAAAEFRLTEKAIRRKIEEGKWIEGREYMRAHGQVWIIARGVRAWIENTGR